MTLEMSRMPAVKGTFSSRDFGTHRASLYQLGRSGWR